MSIHAEIKRLRLALGWSHTRLAAEVSKAEVRKTPLRWQTVQQWEKETAPKRTRLAAVAAALGTTPAKLLSGADAAPASFDDLTGHEGRVVTLFRQLTDDDRSWVVKEMQARVATPEPKPRALHEKRFAART